MMHSPTIDVEGLSQWAVVEIPETITALRSRSTIGSATRPSSNATRWKWAVLIRAAPKPEKSASDRIAGH